MQHNQILETIKLLKTNSSFRDLMKYLEGSYLHSTPAEHSEGALVQAGQRGVIIHINALIKQSDIKGEK